MTEDYTKELESRTRVMFNLPAGMKEELKAVNEVITQLKRLKNCEIWNSSQWFYT